MSLRTLWRAIFHKCVPPPDVGHERGSVWECGECRMPWRRALDGWQPDIFEMSDRRIRENARRKGLVP